MRKFLEKNRMIRLTRTEGLPKASFRFRVAADTSPSANRRISQHPKLTFTAKLMEMPDTPKKASLRMLFLM